MNDFWVQFTEGTSAGEITAGLDAVPASDATFEVDSWVFTAEWGTTQRDLNNLKGRIETGSSRGSVSAIGVPEEDDSSST